MAQWEMFVDESGSFFQYDDKRERLEDSLIGGFVCPKGSFDADTGERWLSELEERFRKNRAFGDQLTVYSLRHANKNHGKTQMRMMLEELSFFRKKIEEIGGFIVVFENPSRLIGVRNEAGEPDNSELYLVMMGMGILKTLDHLRRKDLQRADEETELFCHIAIRANKNDGYADTVVRQLKSGVVNSTIPMKSYLASIESAARMRANGEMRAYPGYKKLFDGAHIEIMTGGEKARTVPCDFICNCYRKVKHGSCPDWIEDPKWKEVYGKRENLILDVFEAGSVSIGDLASMDILHNYAEVFVRLLDLGFPAELTKDFYRLFNKADGIQAQAFVEQVVDHFSAPARGAAKEGDIAEVIKRIQAVADSCGAILNARLKGELRANMYLYLHAMYTHLGDGENVSSSEKAFLEEIKSVTDQLRADDLLEKFYNRRIVSYTDSFLYELGEELFVNKLEPHWKSKLELSDRLANRDKAAATSEEYGREIGSYMQLVRHKLRVSGDEARSVYDELLTGHYYPECERQFSNPMDLSRLHQNISDIEMEMGRYESAFAHVRRAAEYEGGKLCADSACDRPAIDRGSCGAILKHTGKHGSLSPFVYYHLVHLASEMQYHRADQAEFLARCMGVGDITPQSFARIKNPFLKSVIQWRMAPIVLAYGGEDQSAVAFGLYQKAAETLCGMNSLVFSAIAVAVQAELISKAIAYKGFVNIDAMRQRLYRYYGQMKALADAQRGADPFARDDGEYIKPGCKIEEAKTGDEFMRIARIIAY